TSYLDTGLSPDTTYVYRLRACNAVGCSPYSNQTTANTPAGSFALTVAARGSGSGTVASSSGGINCPSSCAASFNSGTMVTLTGGNGLGPYSFTDATLSAGSIAVKGTHFSELRTALDQAYQRVGLPLPTYTDPTLTPGETAVKAAHLSELRSAVRGLE